MKKDKHGNECDKLVHATIYTLASPKFDYFKAVEFTEKLYGSNGIYVSWGFGQCLALSKAQQVKLKVIDGACKWDQNNAEQDDLYDLVGAKNYSGILIFIVGGIKTDATKTLAGCAGHAPSKPAVVVSATGTMYTMAHELGHVLLTSSFTPVHETSTSNIMVSGTHRIAAGSSPTFNAAQVTQIKKSKLLKAC